MLRINLATRPFYNERGVYVVLTMFAVVGLALFTSGVLRVVDLSRRNSDLTAVAERAEFNASELANEVMQIQDSVNPEAIEGATAAAREVNRLIERRFFSWTDFLNRIETTLPSDVMVTEVRPDIEIGGIEVTMGVVGRRLDAINEFIGALEDSGHFSHVLNRQSEITGDEMYRAVLRGDYLKDSSETGETGVAVRAGENESNFGGVDRTVNRNHKVLSGTVGSDSDEIIQEDVDKENK